MTKILFLLAVIFYSPLSFSQETEMHSGVKVIKNATEYAFNLKDSVKSARFFYSFIKEGLNSNERSRILVKNFMRLPFYIEFDRYGMLKKQIDFSGKMDYADACVDSAKTDLYEFDESDRILKRNFKLKNIQVNPIYINEKININFIIKGGGFDKFIFIYIYIYKYNLDGSVLEELSYMPSNEITAEINEENLYTRIVYEYDNKNRLIQQNLYAGEYGKRIGNFTKMSTTIGLCDDAHLSYKYDDKDRVIETSLNCGTTVVQKDEYIYHPEKNYVATIKRFIIDPSMAGYYKQNTVLHYNEHGDMIEINHINNPRESWDK